jgi:hypothetical protein
MQTIHLHINRCHNHALTLDQYIKDNEVADQYTSSGTEFVLIDAGCSLKSITIVDGLTKDYEPQEVHSNDDSLKILNNLSDFKSFVYYHSSSARDDEGSMIIVYVGNNEIGFCGLSEDTELVQLLMHPSIRSITASIISARAKLLAKKTMIVTVSEDLSKREFSIIDTYTQKELLKIDQYNQSEFYTRNKIEGIFKMLGADDKETVMFCVKRNRQSSEPLMCRVEEIDSRLSDLADVIQGNTPRVNVI